MTYRLALSTAMNDAKPHNISIALATVMHSRAKDELQEAQKLASRRSGARGADARKQLLVAEAYEREAEARSVDLPSVSSELTADVPSPSESLAPRQVKLVMRMPVTLPPC